MLNTQVHHINGAGEDAGVVYSEMQARENQSGDLMALEWVNSPSPEAAACRKYRGGARGPRHADRIQDAAEALSLDLGVQKRDGGSHGHVEGAHGGAK
jgi:hypothetical protein